MKMKAGILLVAAFVFLSCSKETEPNNNCGDLITEIVNASTASKPAATEYRKDKNNIANCNTYKERLQEAIQITERNLSFKPDCYSGNETQAFNGFVLGYKSELGVLNCN